MSTSPELPPSHGEFVANIQAQVTEANIELTAHLASWEYAFSMGSGCAYNPNTDEHKATREKTERLAGRLGDLRAQLAEHELQAE